MWKVSKAAFVTLLPVRCCESFTMCSALIVNLNNNLRRVLMKRFSQAIEGKSIR